MRDTLVGLTSRQEGDYNTSIIDSPRFIRSPHTDALRLLKTWTPRLQRLVLRLQQPITILSLLRVSSSWQKVVINREKKRTMNQPTSISFAPYDYLEEK